MQNYFLIPGNPPALHFYHLWGKEIVDIQPKAQVKVASYPELMKTKDSHLAMELMLQHLIVQLKEFQQKCSAPITLVGHSLGGHFALKLLEEMNEVVGKVILLHPFLRRPSRQGRLILRTVSALYHRELVKQAIIKKRHWLELISDELEPVTDEELKKTFHIARHEARTIAVDNTSVRIPQSKREKIITFYHPQDHWCTPNVISDLKEQVHAIECHEPHGFITVKEHRDSLFGKIKDSVS